MIVSILVFAAFLATNWVRSESDPTVRRLRALREPVVAFEPVITFGAGHGIALRDSDGVELRTLLFTPTTEVGFFDLEQESRRGRWCLDPGANPVFLVPGSKAERLLMGTLRTALLNLQDESKLQAYLGGLLNRHHNLRRSTRSP